MDDALFHQHARRRAQNGPALEQHLAAARLGEARHGTEDGRLPRAVRSNQGDQFTTLDLEGYVTHRLYSPVRDAQVPHVKQRVAMHSGIHHWSSTPRYAATTSGCERIADGIPSARS